MKQNLTLLLCTAILMSVGCTQHSTIDAKKTGTSVKEINSNSVTSRLTDKDIFGNETTLTITEEDIQAALEGDELHVPLNSSVILVQSGNRAPETFMQQEMSRYYTVATFSGIPDRQKKISCSKDRSNEDSQDIITAENINWMQALRYVAAKGHQKVIIVYQDTLQFGRYDSITKNMLWSDYKNEKITDNISLRYLVRFTLVDVATGEWATWTPANEEYITLPSLSAKKEVTDNVTEQQILQLKQRTYASIVKDLVNRYQ